MSRPTSQHCIALFVRGLLVLLCALAVPRLASSEPDVAPGHPDIFKKYRLLGLDDFERPKRRVVSRIAPESDGCPVARIDIALERGLLSHSVFLPDKDAWHSAKSGGGDSTTIFVRENNCLIRIHIERATDWGAHDPQLKDREKTKQKREAQ